jgi:spore coat polysaccharide biosynthesis predicted glycosyltransferase SpsG
MRIVLRADASNLIGTGHVMRSLAILEELRTRNVQLVFIGKIQDSDWLTTKINNFGFDQVLNNEDEFTPSFKSDILILDSYTVSVDNPFITNPNWKKIVILCDELTPNYFGDLYIHPGLEADWFRFTNRKILFGTNYIPLRKTIKKNKKRDSALRIIIVGGGTNPSNFVEGVAAILNQSSADFEAICFTPTELKVKLDSRFTRLSTGADLDTYANYSDLAFTTASTTGLEFIAREVACGVGCAIDNQKQYYDVLVKNEVAYPIGTIKNSAWSLDKVAILSLLDSQNLRKRLVDRCRDFIDLRGSTRIADEILGL